VRIEQVYPWDSAGVAAALAKFANLEHVVWVQEEPKNMGPWFFVHDLLQAQLPNGITLRYAGRPARRLPPAVRCVCTSSARASCSSTHSTEFPTCESRSTLTRVGARPSGRGATS